MRVLRSAALVLSALAAAASVGATAASATGTVADLAVALEGDYQGSQIRTIRRTFFNRPGTLYQTPEALIVTLDPFRGQEALIGVIDEFNRERYRLPWLGNRLVVLSLTPHARSRQGP